MTEPSARDRIVDAALASIAESGWEHTSFSAVARRAGVSRPTLYAHFGTRDLLLAAATERAAVRIAERIVEKARRAPTASEFVVEAIVAGVAAFRADPAARLLGLLDASTAPLGDEAILLARSFLEPILDDRPDLEPEMDELAETTIRFLLSLMAFESRRTRTPRALRAYLRRRFVPALGLEPAPAVPGPGSSAAEASEAAETTERTETGAVAAAGRAGQAAGRTRKVRTHSGSDVPSMASRQS